MTITRKPEGKQAAIVQFCAWNTEMMGPVALAGFASFILFIVAPCMRWTGDPDTPDCSNTTFLWVFSTAVLLALFVAASFLIPKYWGINVNKYNCYLTKHDHSMFGARPSTEELRETWKRLSHDSRVNLAPVYDNCYELAARIKKDNGDTAARAAFCERLTLLGEVLTEEVNLERQLAEKSRADIMGWDLELGTHVRDQLLDIRKSIEKM